MLLATGRYAEAREQYESALGRSPNRFRSLYGAGRSAELDGDKAAASRYYGELLANCPEPSGPKRPELEHARKFVAG